MSRYDLSPLAFPPEAYEPLCSAETMLAHRAAADSCALLLAVATDGSPAALDLTPAAL